MVISPFSFSPGSCFFFFNDTATTEIYTLSLHDALPISAARPARWRRAYPRRPRSRPRTATRPRRSEEHTSELQSRPHLVCRLLLEKKETRYPTTTVHSRTRISPHREANHPHHHEYATPH